MASTFYVFAVLFCTVFYGKADVIPPKPLKDIPTCLVRGLPSEANIECVFVRPNTNLQDLLSKGKANQDDTETINLINEAEKVKSIDIKGHDYTIAAQTLRQFPNLQFVQLQGQNESSSVTVDSSAFQGLSKAKHVQFSNVKLPENFNQVIAPLASVVEKLVLYNDKNVKSQSGNCPEFMKLKEFSLTDSDLEEIPIKALRKSASTLTSLRLDNNKITSIKADQLRELVKLETLSLSNNQINQIESNAFEALKEVKVLSLSKNRLSNLSPNFFKSNTRLEHLLLSENPTTGLRREDFSFLTSIQILILP